MEHPVTVSVVIPLYNAADVVAETIESALAQAWTDREILVIDDGSTDGSADVVRTFGDRVRYHLFENGGVAKARNRGIALGTSLSSTMTTCGRRRSSPSRSRCWRRVRRSAW